MNMKWIRPWIVPLLVAISVAACTPATPGTAPGGPGSPSPQAGRTLNITMRVEPPTILEGSVDRSAVHKPLFAATLGAWSLQEEPYPVLAEAVPQLDTDQWKVSPDGRMETVYRLRSGLTWHDGTPLTAEDFVFTLRAERARVEWGLEQSSAELRQIDEITAPDPSTVVIAWRQPYTEAAAPDLIPFPQHIVEPPLDQGDPELFGNLPYWNVEWVGAGPYRIEGWERGAYIEGTAFDDYALGAPKIGNVRLTWGNDPNVNLTQMLAGTADIALDGSLRFEQARTLKERWQSDGEGTIMLNPTSLRYMQTQYRPDYVQPRALLNPDVRAAILHAIDRPTLAETMIEDRTMVADTVPPRTAAYYQAVDDATSKFPYDLRRTEQLMAGAGFTKGSDGVYTSPEEERFHVEVRGVSGGQEEQDTTIVNDFLHRAGFEGQILLLPSSARAVGDEIKGTFPGLTLNNNTLQRGLGLDKWHSSRIGRPETNWVGGNRQGYANPEYDRLHDLWRTTLNRTEATQHLIQMMKLLSEEVAYLPLYYNFQVVAHTTELTGPQSITPDSTRYGNIHQWAWR
ncbi:MAG: hypothetical protein GEU73_11710 [Chloroflexi bacterium]|nr:hypothetical protein [Chloroflexota bacterium]